MDELELKRLLEDGKKSPIRKLYEVKAGGATITENQICCNASVMGIMDRGGDVMFPGSYADCLKAFIRDGFIALGHDWRSLPVAMPTKAIEDGQNLYCEATFHSHDAAQDTRTVCIERLDANKSVGISVGMLPDYDFGVAFVDSAAKEYKTDARIVYFEDGESLLKFAKANGYDMKLFDAKGIRAWKGHCRAILTVKELYEWSVVTVPMNPKATATDAKTFSPFQKLGDASDYLVGDSSFFPFSYQLPTKQLPATIREFEDLLRELGFSNKQAVDIASVGFAKAMQRESATAPEADAPTPEPTTEKVDDGQLLRSLQAASLRFDPLLIEVNLNEF